MAGFVQFIVKLTKKCAHSVLSNQFTCLTSIIFIFFYLPSACWAHKKRTKQAEKYSISEDKYLFLLRRGNFAAGKLAGDRNRNIYSTFEFRNFEVLNSVCYDRIINSCLKCFEFDVCRMRLLKYLQLNFAPVRQICPGSNPVQIHIFHIFSHFLTIQLYITYVAVLW